MVIDSLLYEVGIDPKGLQVGLEKLRAGAQQVDNEFNGMATRWGGAIQGLLSSVIAPVAGAFAVGKVINSYMSDVSEVATLTGAYNQKLDEWRIKRAQLARVTKEDIALYKQYKEAMTGFNIAIADVSAKLMRTFSPVMKKAVEGLQQFTKWINRNQDNIVRFLTVTAGVLTGLFLPAILKTSAALLMSPLTWLIGALGVLVLIIDDLTTYLRGGQSALGGFWSYFGTGPEIMAKLNAAFETFKEIVSVIWKPLTLIAAGFAAFKIGTVLVNGFIGVLASLKAAMTAIAAHPLMVALTALVGLIVWVSDAFKRAGGDWSQVMDIMAQDLIDFLNLFGGLGDYLVEALSDFKGFFTSVIDLIESAFSIVFNLGKLIWAYLSGAPDELKDALIDSLSNALTSGAQAVNDFISALLGSMYTLLQYIGNAISSLGDLILKGLELAISGLVTMTGRVLSLIGALFLSVVKSIGNILSSMAASVGNAITGLWQGLVKLLTDIFGPIPAFFGSLFDSVLGFFSGVGSSIVEELSGINKSIGAFFSEVFTSIGDALNSVVAIVTGALSGAFVAIANIWAQIGVFFGATAQSISDAFSAAWAWIESTALTMFKGIVNSVSAPVRAITQAFASLIAALSSMFTGAGASIAKIWDGIANYFGSLARDIGALWTKTTKGISSLFGEAVKAITAAFQSVKAFLLSVAKGISSSFEWATKTLGGAFAAAQELITKAFAKVKSSIGSIVDSLQELGAQVSQVFSSVVDTITGAFDAGLDAALEFFNSIFDFFAQIPERIAKAFDISGLISGAADKLKGLAGDAMGSVKSFFGLGNDDKEQEKNLAATKQAVQSAMQYINTGMSNNNQVLASTPTVANTSSITNSTYNTDNSRRSDNKQNVNNTININVPNGTDARGIVREAQRSFNNLNASNNMVMASEYGNYNS